MPPSAASHGLLWSGVVFAMVFPAIATWAYFVFAGRYSPEAQQATYAVVKTVQFAFPLLWVLLVLRESLRVERPRARGLFLGAAFGIAVTAAGWLLFRAVLRDMPVFAGAAELIAEKIAAFGIDSVGKYVAMAVFYSLLHSLLEEYYWRWFVFGQLRRLIPLWPAIALSSLAFMAHHVVVLGAYFEQAPALAWLFSAAVAVGGVFWAWLYARTGSLYAPWLSHLLIDAGIFWVGYDLVRDALHG